MKNFLAILLIVLSLSHFDRVCADELKLTASTWPPYTGPQLPENGLVVNLVTSALTRAGYTTSITFDTWPRSLEGTKIGVNDVITGAWHSDERAKYRTFSQPFIINEIKFITRKDRPIVYNNLEDLRGRVIGVVRDYAYGPEFDNATYLVKVPQNHVIQNLSSLFLDKIDLTLADERVARYELQKFMGGDISELTFLPKPLSANGLHIAVSKQRSDHEKIAADFDSAITAMKKDGT
ncbi:MAG: transporter substrate-binding domain-containing protein [Gammaproteobacteria bacterium]|nr:transporter substrate-binding domain-containing protein [Gammaproteobacteria bacterium]MCI0590539.1 transporter substrate-binding domain-containing protein [Gammaproteobacteria bacterium]